MNIAHPCKISSHPMHQRHCTKLVTTFLQPETGTQICIAMSRLFKGKLIVRVHAFKRIRSAQTVHHNHQPKIYKHERKTIKESCIQPVCIRMELSLKQNAPKSVHMHLKPTKTDETLVSTNNPQMI